MEGRKVKTKGELKGVVDSRAGGDFSNMAALTVLEKSQGKKGSQDKGQFSCPVCHKKFKSDQQVNYHEMYHTEDERRRYHPNPVLSNTIFNKYNSRSEEAKKKELREEKRWMMMAEVT